MEAIAEEAVRVAVSGDIVGLKKFIAHNGLGPREMLDYMICPILEDAPPGVVAFVFKQTDFVGVTRGNTWAVLRIFNEACGRGDIDIIRTVLGTFMGPDVEQWEYQILKATVESENLDALRFVVDLICPRPDRLRATYFTAATHGATDIMNYLESRLLWRQDRKWFYDVLTTMVEARRLDVLEHAIQHATKKAAIEHGIIVKAIVVGDLDILRCVVERLGVARTDFNLEIWDAVRATDDPDIRDFCDTLIHEH